jgi:hypothetical protein
VRVYITARDCAVADLDALLTTFEHQNWTPWLARVDSDPSLYLPNAYAIEFLRFNLKRDRLRWFRDQLTTHNLQSTEQVRVAQQRTVAPFRFTAFEEKVIWGDLTDVFHLVYTFSLPDDPLRAILAGSHFDAIYLGDRKMAFISEEFRALMLEIWHVKYLQFDASANSSVLFLSRSASSIFSMTATPPIFRFQFTSVTSTRSAISPANISLCGVRNLATNRVEKACPISLFVVIPWKTTRA